VTTKAATATTASTKSAPIMAHW